LNSVFISRKKLRETLDSPPCTQPSEMLETDALDHLVISSSFLLLLHFLSPLTLVIFSFCCYYACSSCSSLLSFLLCMFRFFQFLT
jgi:hypothetical protein